MTLRLYGRTYQLLYEKQNHQLKKYQFLTDVYGNIRLSQFEDKSILNILLEHFLRNETTGKLFIYFLFNINE